MHTLNDVRMDSKSVSPLEKADYIRGGGYLAVEWGGMVE
jgi:hypothetical protein